MKRPVMISGEMTERETLTDAYEVRVFRYESGEPSIMEALPGIPHAEPGARIETHLRQEENYVGLRPFVTSSLMNCRSNSLSSGAILVNRIPMPGPPNAPSPNP